MVLSSKLGWFFFLVSFDFGRAEDSRVLEAGFVNMERSDGRDFRDFVDNSSSKLLSDLSLSGFLCSFLSIFVLVSEVLIFREKYEY